MSERGGRPEAPPAGIPVSAGIPAGVRISFLAAIALAVAMLALVIAVSAVNHVWPSGNSLKVPL